MTPAKLKEINKNKVYTFIYHQRTTSKAIITKDLEMGLSTVTQNLKLLEEDGLICKNGFFDSTGGRKADAIEIIPTAKISIGVSILKNTLHIVATDLYGMIIYKQTHKMSFSQNDLYYQQLSLYVTDFISSNKIPTESILGVSIATQGIIAKDGQSVSYGKILDNFSMRLANFQTHIPYPCKLEHDSKAAANLELWKNPTIKNAAVLLLNRNMGGAIIINGSVQNGNNMRSGLIEHLCINPDGAFCYCGKRGCLETYCSANSLEQMCKMNVHDFFTNLRKDNEMCIKIWQEYLNYLSLAIRNLSIIIDGKIIISGYLAPYFIEEDIVFLLEQINYYATFPLEKNDIILGSAGELTQAAGASLSYIKEFPKKV